MEWSPTHFLRHESAPRGVRSSSFLKTFHLIGEREERLKAPTTSSLRTKVLSDATWASGKVSMAGTTVNEPKAPDYDYEVKQAGKEGRVEPSGKNNEEEMVQAGRDGERGSILGQRTLPDVYTRPAEE